MIWSEAYKKLDTLDCVETRFFYISVFSYFEKRYPDAFLFSKFDLVFETKFIDINVFGNRFSGVTLNVYSDGYDNSHYIKIHSNSKNRTMYTVGLSPYPYEELDKQLQHVDALISEVEVMV